MSIQHAAGTVPGGQHKNTMKNNQDAFHVFSCDDFTVAVVADGCGSGRYSEMGAQMGAALMCHAVKQSLFLETFRRHQMAEDDAKRIMDQAVSAAKQTVIRKLRDFFEDCTRDEREIADMLCEYGLFTMMCAIVTDTHFAVYAQGDGCFSVRLIGEQGFQIHEIQPMEGNMPPYIGYAVSSRLKVNRDMLVLQKLAEGPRSSLDTIVIASDGLCTHPEPARLVTEWVADKKVFENPQILQRRLNLLNSPKQKIDYVQRRVEKEQHAFGDDCTVVILHDVDKQSSNGLRHSRALHENEEPSYELGCASMQPREGAGALVSVEARNTAKVVEDASA